MNTLSTILNYLQIHWPAILSLVGGGAGVSLALELLLHKVHVDSKKLAFTLLHVLTGVTTVLAVLAASLPHNDALPIYGSLFIAAETWHRFVLSPAYNKVVVPYLQYLASNKPKTGVPTTAQVTESTPVFPA